MRFFRKNSCKKLLRMLKLIPESEKGQVLTEYAIMVFMALMILFTLIVFGHQFSLHGWKMINQIGISYP